ncbi:MAG: hypothetical protein CFH43_01140, partial [Proteobacteria bacterium]
INYQIKDLAFSVQKQINGESGIFTPFICREK